MQKSLLLLLVLCFSLQITSCKTDAKKPTEKIEKTAMFSLNNAKNNINWTAYKTTDKIAVKGKFKKITITKNGDGNSVKEALNNAEFSIPVSSIFTSDTSRDFKIRKFFFGVMDHTELLSGALVLENDSTGYATITMNATTEKLPFTYTISDKTFALNTVMNLDNWHTKNAVDSLNAACKELHKAADGISKTWSEVEIQITSVFE
ncbi:MAG: YceI family protein [Polaribacter sp.]|nr:YceI family protein [Polaribacter sp.]